MTTPDDAVTVSVRNLGGIEDRQVTFDPGVTVLTGRNATNRTSLLRSIAAALGGSAGELKADADEGSVELAVGGATYTRRFERTEGGVRTSGDPYTDESALADLFSCVLATNRARQAAERGDGDALREVVMAPVDTGEIRAEIDRRGREVRTLSAELADAERELDRLPDLRERLAARRDEREAVVEELETVETAVDGEADAPPDEAAGGVVQRLRDAREEYQDVRDRLETQRASVESLEDERESVAERLERIDAPRAELEAARDELDSLQARRRSLENTINNLVSIVEFNEGLADGTADVVPGVDGAGDGDGGDVTSALDPSAERVECWTCGTTVERGEIAERVDDLRSVIEEKRRERDDLRDGLGEQRERVATLREDVQEHESLAAELEDLDEEIDRRESRIDDLTDRVDDLRERIDDLEREAEASAAAADSDLVERYRRLSELEYERGQIDEAIGSLEGEIDAVEAERDRRDRLETEIEAHREALTDLRDRIADLERAAVETFNDHMATVLDRLGYDNVERVWLERKTDADPDAVAPESEFDLHVVRSTPEGSVYDDTVDHLSESEREVIGLVVALAGYLVHDVAETVPFVLLDSLEAIDAERIADLVEYFADHATYLVVALLPEDARALPEHHERVPMDETVA
ncbi:archaea-specific SMC-related protein [Halosimplex salinum]|uniref:archaea-specific SMC-related protein n=1 Tax=Halosimplex salinum TaxID=1710538 RepID=UPI000F4705A4|nr:archaea-specific SMC-related protein [Halosimplex salinum]